MDPLTQNNPTLKDVASVAGCSIAVVSTVINNARGNTLASPAMQARVRDAAKKLGYRPNFASRSLVRRSTDTIRIYVPPDPWAGLGMRYEGAILEGIEQACRTHGYDVLAINLNGAGTPETCAQKFAEQRIDGLVLLHVDHTPGWVAPLVRRSPNVVAVNYYGDAQVERVNFDDKAATAMAVRHLAGLGHRAIGFISAVEVPLGPGADLRCAGYREAMESLGLPVDPQWVWDHGNAQLDADPDALSTPDDGGAGAMHLWRLGANRPTALVAYSDRLAIRAMQRLAKMGVRVPDDMAVVGIDGTEIGELASPELTSIRQPFAEMGRLATERVIRRAKGGVKPAGQMRPSAAETALVAPELVIRQSTGPGPAAASGI